jgi:putative redox protein
MRIQAPDAASPPEHQGFRTTCGREVRAGRLALGDLRRPVGRVSLDIGQAPDGHDGTWAALTVAEARGLAAALLTQAAAAERGDDPNAPGIVGVASAGRIAVTYAGGEAYAITTRGHVLLVDQPADAGGLDAATSPTELLVASLASCVAYYGGRYLARHGLQREGLAVVAEFTMAADRPARVGAVRLRIAAPDVPADRQAALLAVASHCTVHNTLRQEPDVTIALT